MTAIYIQNVWTLSLTASRETSLMFSALSYDYYDTKTVRTVIWLCDRNNIRIL